MVIVFLALAIANLIHAGHELTRSKAASFSTKVAIGGFLLGAGGYTVEAVSHISVDWAAVAAFIIYIGMVLPTVL